jgi:peptidoglycan/LPS O-acetylase OafA/YrhL
MRPETHVRLSLALAAASLALGLGLEALLGVRGRAFMDDAIQRELLRLGHAHGGVLALLNLGLAWGLQRLRTPEPWARWIRLAAWSGALLVALGFVAGGVWHGPTDPGPAVLVVPAGALLVLSSLVVSAGIRGTDR